MNTFKLTLSKLLFSCLAVLFSVSFFSFKSSAHVLINLPGELTSSLEGVSVYTANPEANFLFCFNMQSPSWKPGTNYRSFTQCFVFDSRTSATISATNMGNPYTVTQTTGLVATVDGVDYYGFARSLNGFNAEPYWDRTFLSYEDAIRDYLSVISPSPDYANFSLKGFNYVAYTNEGMFTNRNFNLDYKVSWDGSTDLNYPITRVDYEIYGFSDRTFSNYDKSNGELLNSGEAFDGMSLNVDVLIKDFIGLPNVEKVVVYFIPFSGRTEGNTEFIVCNFYEPYLEFGFRGLGVNIGHLLGMNSLTYGSGNIPVPYTDTVTNGVDSAPVAIVDDVPVLTIDQTISGSFNTYNDYYYSHTTYAPVIYGDTTEINNYYDDHSSVITNNNNYTTIINNFNGSVDVDPESDAYANSIISFLTTLITFFSTFWSYCVVALGWLPGWVQVFVGAIFGLLGTLVIGLGILKLMKGVL